ncbi:MAG: tRNA glutamyl-Q(34) synthetase GluQRS [Candidatus Sericytochromatia bacterium]|nr:tRNA glutamyl-Q(34) synthetase GluQRS [Candidatus Sericytochromatia bacterium]
MISPIRGRYAPSPTGGLHLGNARTALVAWLHTRSRGGSFVLRVEDLDSLRCKKGVFEINLAELRWLGLDWDEGPDRGGDFGPYLQSLRTEYYQAMLEKLQPWVSPCYLSRKDLQTLASAPHGLIEGYGLAERALNESLQTEKIASGKQPSLRLRGPQTSVAFEDLLMGPQAFDVGDFVLLRADGEWAYQLAVVADDLAMQISEVVRGDDLLPSTAAQVWLYQLLQRPAPQFLHLPLLLDAQGMRLSKRSGSLTLNEIQKTGLSSERLLGFFAHSLGLLAQSEPLSLPELLTLYSPEKLSREPYQLRPGELGLSA